MVWEQYVYDAATGNDTEYESENELYENENEYTIENWEIDYSSELHYMWGVINTLLYDAHIEHSGKFCDFVEFCYIEHDDDSWGHEEHSEWYEERIGHIWNTIRRIVNENGLRVEMMRGANFNHFVNYVKNYMGIY
jgi:hypothetical protein